MSSSKIRTLVVGGAGFIGSHLVRLLAADGRRTLTVAGRRLAANHALPEGVKYIAADAQDESMMATLLKDVDEVVDLAYASVPKTSFDDPVHDVLSNLPGSVSLLRMASRYPLRRFLQVSSGGTVYGNARDLPIEESHPTDPVSPYGITKLAAEKYGLLFHQLAKLPIVIARPGNPYGPHQFGNLPQGFIGAAMYATFKRQKVAVFGDRGTVRDYIHVDDLVRGLLAALDHGVPGGVYNIGTGVGYDNMAVLEHLSGVTQLAGYLVEADHREARSFDVKANVLNSERLSGISGWRPQLDLTEGLSRTWEWVLQTQMKAE